MYKFCFCRINYIYNFLFGKLYIQVLHMAHMCLWSDFCFCFIFQFFPCQVNIILMHKACAQFVVEKNYVHKLFLGKILCA
jgi:hypothetical protein